MVEKEKKLNCWDYLKCEHGPSDSVPCPAAEDWTSNGINGGVNAGRLCWTVPGTRCLGESQADFALKGEMCLACPFFEIVRQEEGMNFHLLKLAQGVTDVDELHERIAQIESLHRIRERMHAQFELPELIHRVRREARAVTRAERSVVFLLAPDAKELRGEFILHGKKLKVTVPLDETSAVGYAAVHNKVVNIKDPYKIESEPGQPVFNRRFDEQCSCTTSSLLAVPIRDSEGKVLGVITCANSARGSFSPDDCWFMERYTTDLALGLEKARFLEQENSALRLSSIGETIAGLSHCIKNVAHALRGSSYIIKHALDDGRLEDVREAWKILDKHVEQLADLSQEVLTYEPQRPGGSSKTNFNATVRSVVALLEQEARVKAVTVRSELDGALDGSRVEARSLYRCVMNLVSNALNACPPSGGEISVVTRKVNGEALVAVSDNGSGMTEEQKGKLFKLFSSGRPSKGAGIGLAIVLDVVKKLRGRIEIESSPGQGTTFRIYFPLSR